MKRRISFYTAAGTVDAEVRIDALANICRCATVVAAVALSVAWSVDVMILPFAVGQFVFAVVLSLAYYIRAWHNGHLSILVPRRDHKGHFVDAGALALWLSLFGHSAMKLVLSEGEKLSLMAARVSADDLGVYGLVSNIGSLVARIVLAPLERVTLVSFSRRDLRAPTLSAAARLRYCLVLSSGAHCMALFALTIVAFGPAHTRTLIAVVYGAKWSDSGAPLALSYYCGYLAVMSINGVSEAVAHSQQTPSEIASNTAFMTALTCAHCGALFAASRYGFGAAGIIAANAMIMSVRIVYSVYYIIGIARAVMPARTVTELCARSLPSERVAAAFVAAFAVTQYSEAHFTSATLTIYSAAYHIAAGAAVFGVVCAVVATDRKSRDIIAAARDHFAAD